MTHSLLLSLANIATDVCSKGLLHGHLLLILLPVPTFIHKKSWVHSLLSNRLLHHCLNLILTPLKIAPKAKQQKNHEVKLSAQTTYEL